MTNAYRDIFRAPGSFAFSASGLIARLPVAMITLGIVTMLSQTHGAYWLAGAVSAAFALSNALIAPQVSRFIDRYGQRRVLPPVTIITILALTALMLSARYGAANWVLFLFAILAGFMPSISAMVRARWTEIYRDTPKLHTAFALESVVDEIIYMLGPIISIGLSVALFPEAGPLAATLFLAVGALLFIAQRSTEPPVHAQDKSKGTSVIRLRPLQWIVLTLIAIGAIFGTAEVTAIAFAEEHGQKAAASIVLASYAAGSLIVGLVFGTLKFKQSLQAQFLYAITLAMLTTLPLLFVTNIPALAVILFLAGAAVSPTIIISMGLIERLVPPSKLTEGITWAMTGIGIGMALGSSVSGLVIDAYGARYGFCVSIAAGVIALIIAMMVYRNARATCATNLEATVSVPC
ncbi:MFS transporter [Phyllobacterium sp. OV277]|uniref:MFS transporter n=1 Tax=Phyllobacterium sp. OV277 TaxID=1882772 RepID=UPI00088438AB|nr:MFS transporter [Phyllobacterium sp. OV277]SDO06755.1 Predicted arabinose efflux permease, MFS family [Phyllobacterium sp. OV277]